MRERNTIPRSRPLGQLDFGPADGPEHLPIEGGDLKIFYQVDLCAPYAELLTHLVQHTKWRQEQITVYGKAYLQPRLSAWYGDKSYRYSGIHLAPMPWTAQLLEIKSRVENLSGHDFNSVLLNYYRDHNDSMGMHSDDEPELGAQPVIASLTLGETRDFLLRHKTDKGLKTIKLPLPAGSLLLMCGDTQCNWRHGIGRQKLICGPRINLTFRNVTGP